MATVQELIEQEASYLASQPHRKPGDVLGRILRHSQCTLDWKTATVEDFAAEVIRIGAWDFATLARMGI